jgi:hypothetical protein
VTGFHLVVARVRGTEGQPGLSGGSPQRLGQRARGDRHEQQKTARCVCCVRGRGGAFRRAASDRRQRHSQHTVQGGQARAASDRRPGNMKGCHVCRVKLCQVVLPKGGLVPCLSRACIQTDDRHRHKERKHHHA